MKVLSITKIEAIFEKRISGIPNSMYNIYFESPNPVRYFLLIYSSVLSIFMHDFTFCNLNRNYICIRVVNFWYE